MSSEVSASLKHLQNGYNATEVEAHIYKSQRVEPQIMMLMERIGSVKKEKLESVSASTTERRHRISLAKCIKIFSLYSWRNSMLTVLEKCKLKSKDNIETVSASSDVVQLVIFSRRKLQLMPKKKVKMIIKEVIESVRSMTLEFSDYIRDCIRENKIKNLATLWRQGLRRKF